MVKNVSTDRSFHEYLGLDILTNSDKLTLTKKKHVAVTRGLKSVKRASLRGLVENWQRYTCSSIESAHIKFKLGE